MKNLFCAALALALVTTTARADPPTASLSTDAGYARLAEFTGLWTVRQSLWLQDGAPPQVDAGTAVFTPVLGGRQLQQDLRVASRVPFQALGYIGYDARARTYRATWMDLNLANALTMRGRYDDADRTFRFSGDTTFDDGQVVPTREELHRVDADHFIVRYFETRRGRETLVVELAYSRR